MEENRFYVYGHYLEGTLVFIGKGTGDRYIAKRDRNKEHSSVWDSLSKEIIAGYLTESQAISYVSKYLSENEKPLFNRFNITSKVNNIDPDYYNTKVYYDESSPTFLRWNTDIRSGNGRQVLVINKGDIAGCFNSKGYAKVVIDGKSIACHRLIYSILNNTVISKNLQIDHIDGNRSNNNINNLRLVTAKENSRNRKVSRKSVSGVNGVSWDKYGKRWRLYFTDIDGKNKLLYFRPDKMFKDIPYEDAYAKCFEYCVNLKKEMEELYDLYRQ